MFNYLIKFLYLPFFLLIGNGLAVFLVVNEFSELWLVAEVCFFIASAFFLERIVPFDRNFNQSHGDSNRDIIHAFVNESMNITGLMMIPFLAGSVKILDAWPTFLPLWLQLIIAILIADIGISLAHFASHRVDFLWRLHSVHHSIKRMYGLNGLMKHPIHQLIETLAGTTPLLLLGVPHDVLVLLVVAVVLQLLVQHSNVAYFSGPIKKILVTNSLHRFHHLNTAKEGDVNFGLFTTITDYLLGTVYFDKKRVIRSEDLGISVQPNYPVAYLKQLIQPFK